VHVRGRARRHRPPHPTLWGGLLIAPRTTHGANNKHYAHPKSILYIVNGMSCFCVVVVLDRESSGGQLGAIPRTWSVGRESQLRVAQCVECGGARRLEDADPRPRMVLADRLGQPDLPYDGDSGRRTA